MKCKAFTLVELLVVLSIVAVLAAILFPIFASARSKARQSVCESNLRQICGALDMYTRDYDGGLPRISYGAGIGSSTVTAGHWTFILQPYIRNTNIFECPADLSGSRITNCTVECTESCPTSDRQTQLYSYIPNENTVSSYRFLNTNESEFTSPSSTIEIDERRSSINRATPTWPWAGVSAFDPPEPCINLAAVFTTRQPNPGPSTWTGLAKRGDLYTYAQTGAANAYLRLAHQNPSSAYIDGTSSAAPMIVRAQWARHSNGSNYLFVDGHVRWMRFNSTMSTSSLYYGDRFYPKPDPATNHDPTGVQLNCL